jgi:hypothetical protein
MEKLVFWVTTLGQIVAPIDGESEIGIKLLGEFDVFSGHERLEIRSRDSQASAFPKAKC